MLGLEQFRILMAQFSFERGFYKWLLIQTKTRDMYNGNDFAL